MNVREWALPVYTILMQMATGMLLVLWVIRSVLMKKMDGQSVDKIFRKPIFVVLITLIVAMIGSHFHLSYPLISFLAILNLRNSWLSREVFFTVLFFVSNLLLCYYIWFYPGEKGRLKTILGWIGVTMGVCGVFSMSTCYQIPTQDAWNHPTTIILFYCSALILGLISIYTIFLMDAIFCRDAEPELALDRYMLIKKSSAKFAAFLLFFAVLILLMNFVRVLDYQFASPGDDIARVTLTLLFQVYRILFYLRIFTLLAGVLVFAVGPFLMIKRNKALDDLVFPTYLSCLLLLMGEILGRFLFYAAHIRMGV